MNTQDANFFTHFDSFQHFSDTQIVEQRKVTAFMQPRFMVIEMYPFTEYTLHQIICPVSKLKIDHFRSFPKLFEEVKWYVGLSAGSMPSYLKSKREGHVYRVVDGIVRKSVDGKSKTIVLEDYTGSQGEMIIDDYLPTTEFDYNAYVKKVTTTLKSLVDKYRG